MPTLALRLILVFAVPRDPSLSYAPLVHSDSHVHILCFAALSELGVCRWFSVLFLDSSSHLFPLLPACELIPRLYRILYHVACTAFYLIVNLCQLISSETAQSRQLINASASNFPALNSLRDRTTKVTTRNTSAQSSGGKTQSPLSFLPPSCPSSILTVSNALLRLTFAPSKYPSVQTALGFRMLLPAALFIALTTLFDCAASSSTPRPRHVVDVRRPRGLVPRQNIPPLVLNSTSDAPAAGIAHLVLASDQRCASNCPI